MVTESETSAFHCVYGSAAHLLACATMYEYWWQADVVTVTTPLLILMGLLSSG